MMCNASSRTWRCPVTTALHSATTAARKAGRTRPLQSAHRARPCSGSACSRSSGRRSPLVACSAEVGTQQPGGGHVGAKDSLALPALDQGSLVPGVEDGPILGEQRSTDHGRRRAGPQRVTTAGPARRRTTTPSPDHRSARCPPRRACRRGSGDRRLRGSEHRDRLIHVTPERRQAAVGRPGHADSTAATPSCATATPPSTSSASTAAAAQRRSGRLDHTAGHTTSVTIRTTTTSTGCAVR